MSELKSSKMMYQKAVGFVVILFASATMILLESPTVRTSH